MRILLDVKRREFLFLCSLFEYFVLAASTDKGEVLLLWRRG